MPPMLLSQNAPVRSKNIVKTSLVVVDSRVSDVSALVADASTQADVLLLSTERDAIAQITEALSQYSHLSSLHIVSHGEPGRLHLGSAQLSLDTLGQHADSLEAWAEVLAGKDILLYGCQVARGALGHLFVRQLQQLTGANVAAATERIGRVGDRTHWILDTQLGSVETPIAFSDELQASYAGSFETVSFSVSENTLIETQGTPFSFLFEVDGAIPEGGSIVRLEADRPQAINQWNIFAAQQSGLAGGLGEGYIDVSPGLDFSAFNIVITEPTASISLPVFNDPIAEGEDAYTWTITPVSEGTSVNIEGDTTTTIYDDPSQVPVTPVIPEISFTSDITTLVEDEGTEVTFTLELSEAPTAPIVVDLDFGRPFALGDFDVFPPGPAAVLTGGQLAGGDADNSGFLFSITAQTATITLPIFDDPDRTEDGSVSDPNGPLRNDDIGEEQVVVTLVPGDGYTVAGSGSVTLTLRDTNFVNTAPVADDDSYSTEFETVLTIDAAAGVLDGDTDVDGDDLSAAIESGPGNGSVELNGDGSFTYTPDAGFSGNDTFTYAVSDGNGGSDTATVTVEVAEPVAVNTDPVAGDDSYSTAFDSPLSVDAAAGILSNDSDSDGDDLSIALEDGPDSGNVQINDDGSFTYTPDAGFSGSDTFTYAVSDGNGGSDTATVTVEVAEPVIVNTDPDAGDDGYSVAFETPLAVGADAGVLSNDTDSDGDDLDAALEDGPDDGSVELNSDGSFTYTPDAGFSGDDTFTYTVSDGEGGSDTATVTVSVAEPVIVNTDPNASDDSYSTEFDSPLTVDADAGVLSNDADADRDPLSAALEDGPDNGSVELNGDGSFTYTPDAGFSGDDSFTYIVSDGNGGTDTAEATVNVNAPGEPVVSISASTATVNEADETELTLNFSVDGEIQDGGITVDLEGSAPLILQEFTAAQTRVTDEGLIYFFESDTVDTVVGGELDSEALEDDPSDSGFLSDFSFTITDPTASITFSVLNDVAEEADQDFTYTLLAGDGYSVDSSADSVSFTVTDGVDVVGPTVGVTADTTALFEDSQTRIELTFTVDGALPPEGVVISLDAQTPRAIAEFDISASNPRDPEDELTVDGPIVTGGNIVGSNELASALIFRITEPTATLSVEVFNDDDAEGLESYTFALINGEGYQVDPDNASVDITIEDGTAPIENVAPVADDDSYSTAFDTALTVDAAAGVLDGDTDADGDDLSAAIETEPDNGSVTLNSDGSFTYTPDADFAGEDTFTYTVSDGEGGEDTGTVTVTVNDEIAPLAVGISAAPTDLVEEDGTVTTLSFTLSEAPPDGGIDVTVDSDIPASLAEFVVSDASFSGLQLVGANDDASGFTVNITEQNATISLPVFDDDLDEGLEEITYALQAGDGYVIDDASSSVTLSITDDDGVIIVPNSPPDAEDDSYSTALDTALTVSAGEGVLTNDTDADGDALVATFVGNPDNGSVTLEEDGSFTYTPDAGFSGTDSFTYQASDGEDNSEVTTVTINVAPDDAPPVIGFSTSTNFGGDENALVEDEGTELTLQFDLDGPAPTGGLRIFLDSETEQIVNRLDLQSFAFNPQVENINPSTVGTDFDNTGLVLTIDEGETSASLTIPIFDNVEPSEILPETFDGRVDAVFSLKTADQVSEQDALDIQNISDYTIDPDAASSTVIFVDTASQLTVGGGGPIEFDIIGDDSAETIVGDTGDDAIDAGGGNDTVAGGLGDDVILGGDGEDVLRGDLNSRRTQNNVAGGNDIIFGGTGDDRIGGKSGDDILSGGEGDDLIYGDAGNDIIMGVTGDDILIGDNFSGGTGSDLFVFGNGDGTDTILDFQVNIDRIGLVAGELTFEDLTITQSGSDASLGVTSTGETIAVLRGIQASSLTQSSFETVADVSNLEDAIALRATF
ncbi:MAG: Ig-like domain-containing protein [Cyanobacteria bacterium P01_D01_bin.1]